MVFVYLFVSVPSHFVDKELSDPTRMLSLLDVGANVKKSICHNLNVKGLGRLLRWILYCFENL